MEPVLTCPACFGALEEVQVGAVKVDVCRAGCGGIWFDAFELQKVDDPAETAGERLVELQVPPRVAVDPARKRICPRCADIKLHRHFFSARRRVQVDQCPNCGGYWLDAGELEQIRAEREPRPEGVVVITSEVIRYIYRQANA